MQNHKLTAILVADAQLPPGDPTPSEFTVDRMARLLQQSGQVENVVVVQQGKGYEVIYGATIVAAAAKLQRPKVQAIVLTGIDEAEKLRIKMELMTTRFPSSNERLGKLLASITEKKGADHVTGLVPMGKEDLDALIHSAMSGWADYTSKKEFRDLKRNPVRQRTFTVTFSELQWQRWGKLVKHYGQDEQTVFEKVLHEYTMAND